MPKVTDPGVLRPYWATNDGRTCRLYKGDVLTVLNRLKPKSVQCVVTSPPYWGLRDYGAGTQEIGSESRPDCLGWATGNKCGECHICNMVEVFHEVHRVLRDDGVCWVNYGDTYSGGKTGRDDKQTGGGLYNGKQEGYEGVVGRGPAATPGLPSGNLVGVPWRVALALQAVGWILRQDIIWHKPAPMPESVRNRCTKAHEYVFLFAKRTGYFYDAEAIKEKGNEKYESRYALPFNNGKKESSGAGSSGAACNTAGIKQFTGLANKRSVWSIASHGYPGAHFATFPPALIEPMILAGTSEKGACAECGMPWRRVTDSTSLVPWDERVKNGAAAGSKTRGYNENHGKGMSHTLGVNVRTTGWQPGCECNGKFVKRRVDTPRKAKAGTGTVVPTGWAVGTGGNTMTHNTEEGRAAVDLENLSDEVETTITEYVPTIPLDQHPVVPCVVLDPFVGSGTTCYAALKHGRYAVGIDLSEKYLKEHAIPRVVGALGAKPSTAGLVAKEGERVELGGKASRGTL